jgi:hypothetical protein
MHTHGRTSSKNRAEARETPRRADTGASRSPAAEPLTAQNVLSLQRSIGNAAVTRLVATEQHTHVPVQRAKTSAQQPSVQQTPVQRAKTEEARGKHQRRIDMAETAANQLAGRVNAGLKAHIFHGAPIGGSANPEAPQGLHAYLDDKGTLPSGIVEVDKAASVGRKDKVHVITWRYKESRDAKAVKKSTMFPVWMPPNHVLALIALERPENMQGLAVNETKNVRTKETDPVTISEIKTHILRGVKINIERSGNTVYPTHSGF